MALLGREESKDPQADKMHDLWILLHLDSQGKEGRKMTAQEFGVYLTIARSDYVNNKSWQRMGQSFMNTLGDLHPEIYEAITGTYSDPFHDDAIVPQFLSTLWNHYVDGYRVDA
jgi:hypothetical protein